MKKLFIFLAILNCSFVVAQTQNIDSIVNHISTSYLSGEPRVGVSIGVINKGNFYEYYFGSTQKNKIELPI